MEGRCDIARPLSCMSTVSPVYRHNDLLHTPLGASRSVRNRADFRPSGGEDPRIWQISRGGEDATVFPLGTPTRQWSSSLSRQERRHMLSHASDGSLRKYPRGLPEPSVVPVDMTDLLSPQGRHEHTVIIQH
eukprot:TRINITY_DN18330_c0_g1_i1.p1 TRINITY_DN18330_c0_g1~~TRINITY_DN18330_c0_g1_i1.p1  ORF type:complete len:132 (+),score=9.24 TRINITY_DN18330_c0_g1_i1:1-396(+)